MAGLTVEDQISDQDSHQTALGVVHIESVTQPTLGLVASTGLAFCVLLGDQVWRKVLGEILHHEATFRQDQFSGIVLVHTNDGRFSDGVNFLHLIRCEHIGPALEDFDVIGNVTFFEEPHNSLRAGLLEPSWS